MNTDNIHFQVLVFHFLYYTAGYPNNYQGEVLLQEIGKTKQLCVVQRDPQQISKWSSVPKMAAQYGF